MMSIAIEINEALEECPFIQDWINIISNQINKSEPDMTKVTVFYSYGFFVTKGIPLKDNTQLLYKDRLEVEMSKVRVNIGIKFGNTMFSNRTPNGYIPKSISDIISEIIKIKMIIEYDYHNNDEVRDSIPELKEGTIVEYIKIRNEMLPGEELSIDDILDKISSQGVESLTKEEKDFLDKKSKDV